MLSTLRSERTRKYKSMHANLKGPCFTTRCVDDEPLQKLACGWCGRVHPEAWVDHDATLLAGLRDAYQFKKNSCCVFCSISFKTAIQLFSVPYCNLVGRSYL